jgi:D-glycero-D-manno-heptose 1,7-bisphosphate phosphatase
MGVGEVKTVFLDRDGVLNRMYVVDGTPHPPEDVAQFEVYPDVAESLRRLKDAGYLLIVVTNQPDVARGTTSLASVHEINASLSANLPIEDFIICPHDDTANCPCRKPKPGMILDAARHYGADLAESFMVGDRWRDVDAGANAGVRTVWIDRGVKERDPDHAPDFVTHSLAGAVDWILAVARATPSRE